MTKNPNTSFPFPSNLQHEPNKDEREDASYMIKTVPSKNKTQDEIENEKKMAKISLRRTSGTTKDFNASKASKAKEKEAITESKAPIIKGKANINLNCQLKTDQLCCQYNSDYTTFASGGVDGIVKIFDVGTGDCLLTILGGKDTQGQTACVTSVHYKIMKNSGVDLMYCTYVNGLVKCFNPKTGECLFTKYENRQTYGLAFHPRLPKFITYGDDLKINLYDYETQEKEKVFESSMFREIHDGPTSRVFAGCFNPSSATEFITGGWDETVLLWDLRRPHAVRNISGVHICGEGLDIDANGTQVLTCSWRENDQLQIWDYSTFKLITTMIPDIYPTKLYCGRFISPQFLTCGGGDPALIRIVDRVSQKSKVSISNLPSNACHLHVGKPKSISFMKKKSRSRMDLYSEDDPRLDVSKLPNIIVTCGKQVYEVNFPLNNG